MDKSIGDLFRNYGEDYIKKYKPPLQHIKIIRAIRVCGTPALGGKRITCDSCSHSKSFYYSCGQSQCPLCQNRKRQLWQEKLAQKFLAVPYCHIIFTIPKELNTLARLNPWAIYSITLRAAWQTIKGLTADPENLGALPGMVSMLHTFGSDMKHHIHVHSLVTFGGLDKNGKWQWPKHRKKLARYKEISKTYRDTFIEMLEKEVEHQNFIPVNNMDELIEMINKKRWNVRNQYPTTNTEIIERYLARYINRIAISKSRLEYVAAQEKINDVVKIKFKDYRNQIKGQAAPFKFKSMHPLVAINQFLVHVLPPYFQKARYCGIHSTATFKRIKDQIPNKLIRNNCTIRIIFSILKYLAGLKPYECEVCKNQTFQVSIVKPDANWVFQFITLPAYRGPPKTINLD